MKNIAIPRLEKMVAPRFEAARSFLIVNCDSDRITEEREVVCDGPDGYRLARLLQIHRVDLLLCNGIRAKMRDVLVASGISVLANRSGPVSEVLNAYLQGHIDNGDRVEDVVSDEVSISHPELVLKARRMFTEHGYEVTAGPGDDAVLVDLVAELNCPICRRPIRVAVCCAAHTYRADQEISEFHRGTLSGYNARVYISPTHPGIWRSCREYGIMPIDPDTPDGVSGMASGLSVPLLQGPIEGHEKLTGRSDNR